MDEIKIDWEKLKNPGGIFKLFYEDPEDPIVFHKKWVDLKKMLKTKYLYLSDEYREDAIIDNIISSFFPCVFYEMGDFQGLIGFTKIFHGNKCGLMFKIWDKKLFGHNFVKECRRLVDIFFNEWDLKRMSVESPDKDMVRLSKLAGFKVEGKEPYGFKFKGKFYTNYMLGKVREDGDGMSRKRDRLQRPKNTGSTADNATARGAVSATA